MSILITGGDSFISKSIKPYLESKGHYIYAPNRNTLDCKNPLQLFNFVNSNQCEFNIVIHCASKGGRRFNEEKSNDLYDNLLMLNNILKFQKQFKFKLILFGSGAEYDIRNNIFNAKEYYLDSIPIDNYGLFKRTQTRLIENKLKIYNLRLFNVFSEHGMSDSFIPTCINNCINNKPIEIWEDKFFTTFYGEDLAILVDFLINYKENKFVEYNCGYKDVIKLSTIAQDIKNLTNSKSEIIIKKEIGKSYHGNCDRLYSLGLPFNGLEKGILKCIENIKTKNC